MSAILQFPALDYFGGCPRCGGNDGNLNVGRQHWFRCDKHRTKWLFGENLFSAWKEENPLTWERNKLALAKHRVVEPAYARGQP